MIIWLASYPKSGNTWVRSIIAALMHTDDGIFKFELLNRIKQFPRKKYFKGFTNDFENIHEIKKYWETAQDTINLDNKVKFFKTHHINCKIDQYSFTSKRNTLATIYIIRDPRNLVNSISNHFSKSVEDSKKFLFAPKIITKFEKEDNLENDSLITLLGTWNEHYKFWKNNNENFLLIKYEDLINNTNSELDKIIAFIKRFTPIQTNEIKNKNIIKTTSFNYLQNLEEKGDFDESAYDTNDTKKKFFNLGPKNNWENILNKKIKDEIESKFYVEMKELGYL